MSRFPASPLKVWSAEQDAVQVVWGDLPEGRVNLDVRSAGDRSGSREIAATAIDHVGGAGGCAVIDLPSGSDLQVRVSWEGGTAILDFATLHAPPGERLGRLATVSDMHLGVKHWGVLKTMTDEKAYLPPGIHATVRQTPGATRCGRGAIKEATIWGAERILIKGDSANHQTPACFDEFHKLLDSFPDTKFHLIPGNHDVDRRSEIDIPTAFGSNQVPLIRDHDSFDIEGLRVILLDSTVEGMGPGSIARHQDAVTSLASESPAPVLLATHHHFQERRFPTYWPLGIPTPESANFLDALDQANPNIIVTSGHTHRNRIRRHGNVLLTQVASTRDWPGVWAGYTVYEGGVVQIVRRITTPGAIHWHEYSKDAVAGLWRFWADGPMEQRSFCHLWV